MRNVIFFSFAPWWLGDLIGVSAAIHYSCDLSSEFTLDITKPSRTAAIFHCIVQQRRDRFRFIRAVFHRDRSDPKNMPDVGNPGLFPEFAAVNSDGVYQRFFKLRR